ncbi:MAG: hypothetical protein ABIR11_07165 [Candidatus Limnocylindrales bacterium]
MALVFGDSFDHYNIADILKKWTSKNAALNSDIGPAYALPPHGSGLVIGGSSGSYIEKTLPATQETFIAGVWFRISSFATVSAIMTFIDGSTEHVSVRYDNTAHLTFTRNGTVLATSSSTMSVDTWYHIEVKVTIGDTADSPTGRYQVQVNGTATGWIADSGTGVDTRNAGNKYITGVRLNCFTNASAALGPRFQDFYILNTTGSVAVDFLGPCRFQVIRPTGVGNSAQWTGNYADNWQNVNDFFGDSDSTFNQHSTAGGTDLFTMGDVPAGTVHALQHVLMARQDAGAARTVRPKTRISATNYSGTSIATAASYVFITEPVSVSPATSAQWTAAEVNAAEFGYELVS